MIKKFAFIFSLSLACASLNPNLIFARGGSDGAGGSALQKEGRFVFFDLRNQAQAITESNLGLKIIPNYVSKYSEKPTIKFHLIPVQSFDGYSKLKKISETYRPMKLLLQSADSEVVWVSTNANLKPLHDIVASPGESYSDSEIIQVAIHTLGMVISNETAMKSLGGINQSAAIVHEMLRVMAYQRNIILSTASIQTFTERMINQESLEDSPEIELLFKPERELEKDTLAIKAVLSKLDDPAFSNQMEPDLEKQNARQLQLYCEDLLHKLVTSMDKLSRSNELETNEDIRLTNDRKIRDLAGSYLEIDAIRASFPDTRAVVARNKLLYYGIKTFLLKSLELQDFKAEFD